MCLPSHCLYFPLLGGSNLINSFTLKGSANDCECAELAVRPNPPKLHGWEWKASTCLKKKIGSYQEGEWLLRKLIKTNTVWFVLLWEPPFFFPFMFPVPIWAGFSVTAPEKQHYCHEGSIQSSWEMGALVLMGRWWTEWPWPVSFYFCGSGFLFL